MNNMKSPYENLPPEAFWSASVAERSPLDPGRLYQPKIRIPRKTRFVTAGSCFAQHVGRALRGAGLTLLDCEPLPDGIPQTLANRFGYGLYSARYGNIYTARHMLQVLREALGEVAPQNPVWKRAGRFFDAQRPAVEPNGLPSPKAVRQHRKAHLQAVRKMLTEVDVFVFTFGLTEAWISRGDGTVYPNCPGTVAGTFDAQTYAFHNFSFTEVRDDFLALRQIIKQHSPQARFVITVSPVPLTATASGKHVEVASSYSKAVLRAVCGNLSDRLSDVDYFPSYEIITSPAARGAYYNANLRSVSQAGVDTAMQVFLEAHNLQRSSRRVHALREKRVLLQSQRRDSGYEDEFCEDALLEVFAK